MKQISFEASSCQTSQIEKLDSDGGSDFNLLLFWKLQDFLTFDLWLISVFYSVQSFRTVTFSCL